MLSPGWLRSLAVVCAALTAAPRPVGAAAPAEALAADAKAEAKRLFDEGSEAYNLGNFVVVIEWFEAAYSLTRANALLYNIAQAYARRYELDQDPAHLRKAKLMFENFAKICESSGEDPRDARARAAAIAETLAGLAAEPSSPPPEPTVEPPPAGPEPAPAAPKKLPYRPGTLGVVGYAAIGAGLLAGAALLTSGLISESRLEAQRSDESMFVNLTPERAALYGQNLDKAGALAFGGLGAGLGLAAVGAALVVADAVRGRRAGARASLRAGGLVFAF